MSDTKKLRVAVLISGNGSNLQAIIDDITNNDRNSEIVVVICNNPDAFGLQRATKAGIKTAVITRQDYPDKNDYDAALQQALDQHQADLIVLAGFMRILTDDFVNHNLGKLINIHPSLLPRYKGLNTHQRALDDSATEHGATVHFVTPTLDDGPVIMQAKVPVLINDDATSLADRVHGVEHIIYPMVVNLFAEGRLSMHDHTTLLDGKPVTEDQLQCQLT